MSDTFQGFSPRPNLTGYTALPNEFFDEVLPQINNMSELKILLAVFRKTYGWVKEIDPKTGQPIYKLEDEISYTQFEKLTGLSSTSIATGLGRAISNGYLEKVQQGNYSGVTSAYKVVTTDGSKPTVPTPAPQPKPEPPKVKKATNTPQYFKMDESSDVNIPNGPKPGKPLADFLGTTESEDIPNLSAEKQDMLNDIFGSTAPTPKPKEEKKTPHQEFIKNWFRCYFSKFNISYPSPTGKEHGHIKSILKDYDLATVIKAMEFYFNNYDKLDGVPTDYPTITVFYSWRKKIIPSSLHGTVAPQQPKRNAREFDDKTWEEKGGDFFDN